MRTTILIVFLAPVLLRAQDYVQPSPTTGSGGMASRVNIGLGVGLDYGGLIGVHAGFLADPHFGGFAGVGYALVGAGYNAGVFGRILPEARFCPVVSAMYGYNAVIKVEGASQYDRIYYGPSFGAGVEFHKRSSKNFWRLQILVPLRPQAYQNDMDALKRDPRIEIRAEPPAFGISGGFHFGL